MKGGFLRKLHGPDLRALARRWQEDVKPDSSRREAFARLFPCAEGRGYPCLKDIDLLAAALKETHRPLEDDRDSLRAHRYEHPNADRADARRLRPADVSEHLKEVHRFLADLHILSAMNWYPPVELSDAEPRDAEDLVDLILWGPIGWIIEGPGGMNLSPEQRHRGRRVARYAELHAMHDERGAPSGEAFNDSLPRAAQR